MKWKAYVIGYDPPDMPMEHVSEHDIARIMAEADCCVEAPGGLPVGKEFRTGTLAAGTNGSSPAEGTVVRVVGHAYFGKIACLEEVPCRTMAE